MKCFETQAVGWRRTEMVQANHTAPDARFNATGGHTGRRQRPYSVCAFRWRRSRWIQWLRRQRGVLRSLRIPPPWGPRSVRSAGRPETKILSAQAIMPHRRGVTSDLAAIPADPKDAPRSRFDRTLRRSKSDRNHVAEWSLGSSTGMTGGWAAAFMPVGPYGMLASTRSGSVSARGRCRAAAGWSRWGG